MNELKILYLWPLKFASKAKLNFFLVTSNQIERLWSRFTSLDKQQKGYLTREDFLRIPELAINPLGDRIVHAFFRESRAPGDTNGDATSNSNSPLGNGGLGGSGVAESVIGDTADGAENEVVNFCDFVRVLAHFRPLKKKVEKNKLNGRDEKLKCKRIFSIGLSFSDYVRLQKPF